MSGKCWNCRFIRDKKYEVRSDGIGWYCGTCSEHGMDVADDDCCSEFIEYNGYDFVANFIKSFCLHGEYYGNTYIVRIKHGDHILNDVVDFDEEGNAEFLHDWYEGESADQVDVLYVCSLEYILDKR